jgi:tRNA uridine 5-carboxymethylaminomethyl modification enzyme
MFRLDSYDVAVVGGGHAGIEAAVAAAKLGVKVALFTLSLDAIGNLPCNPSIGGTAKGHLVREVDAMGGCMGLAADATFIQSRMLNLAKGPAVHSLRVQTDRARYHLYMKKLLENTVNLSIMQTEITEVIMECGQVTAIRTRLGAEYGIRALVLATGTYLGGKVFVGESNYASGPDGTQASALLSASLRKNGLRLRRFKTGTPARVHRRSIDFSLLDVQPGDSEIIPFSFMTEGKMENKADCHIAFTNADTHAIIRRNLHRSPLYAGEIQGVGPRYCPSIEDKVVRFADRHRHQIFVEPCGLDTEECYLQGMSSSLPEDVQVEMYRTIRGFARLELMRPAYAIEYDCIDPTQLRASLESKEIKGLYGAGQFNGSSGYEEAAAQGLVAGLNAARAVQGEAPVGFTRQQSYIGTLIDDKVTTGVSDPYRMMTSRSEYRLYLRQDNADERLTPLGREAGLVDDARWRKYTEKKARMETEIDRLKSTKISPQTYGEILGAAAKGLPKNTVPAAELLRRPEVAYRHIRQMAGPGEGIDAALERRIETELKYEGYIARQLEQIEAVRRKESLLIPEAFSYQAIAGMRLEAREKLTNIRPANVGQAARVPGVSPSDIAQLTLALAGYAPNSGNRE